MKTLLTILLILWMLFTMILIFSIIGMLFLAPVSNDTEYYKPMTDDRRSTWMLIGLGIFKKLIE